MKKLITILFLFTSVTLFAQTKLDSLVLVKVNDYRTSKGLTKVEFDNFGGLLKKLVSVGLAPGQPASI